MRRPTILFFVLLLVLMNVFIPINAEAADTVYMSPASEIIDIDKHWARESISTLVNLEIFLGIRIRRLNRTIKLHGLNI